MCLEEQDPESEPERVVVQGGEAQPCNPWREKRHVGKIPASTHLDDHYNNGHRDASILIHAQYRDQH